MQLRRPKTRNPGSPSDSQGSFVGRPMKRPHWLMDWIANKGKYVQLACGHKVDLKWHGQTTLEGLGDKANEVLTNCDRCGTFSAIERGLSWNEFKGIPTAVMPEEPLF